MKTRFTPEERDAGEAEQMHAADWFALAGLVDTEMSDALTEAYRGMMRKLRNKCLARYYASLDGRVVP